MTTKRMRAGALLAVCLMLLAALCFSGCKKDAPTEVGLLVRWGEQLSGTEGLVIPVSAGDTAGSIALGQNLAVLVRLSDGTTNTLTEGADGYRIEGELPGTVEANTAYTLRVVYRDFSMTLTFVAPPAVPTITVRKTLDKAYDGAPVSLTAGDLDIVGESEPVFTWYEKDTDDTWRALDTAPTVVGSYKVVITLAGSEHFTEGVTEVPFAITRAVPDVSEPQFAPAYYAGEVTTLADIPLPAGFAWDDAGQALTPGKKVYTATYTPEDTDNYEVRAFTWELTYLRPVAKPTVKGSYTYDPDADAVLELDGFDEGTMCIAPGSAATTQTNAGDYLIRVDLKDPETTCWSDKSRETVGLTWTVARRTPVYDGEAPTIDAGTYVPGRTLADLALPDAGQWRWEAPETPVTCDRTAYTALWCPAGFDNANYQPARVTVTVTVARASAWDETMTPGTIEVYKDEVTSLDEIDPNAGLDRTRGIFRFEEGQTLATGRRLYRLYFIPTDAVNYSIVHNIEVEICYRAVLTVPVIKNDMTPTRGLAMTILMELEGYDENLMEAVDEDGYTMALEQSSAGVFAYYFRLKDTDAYAWAGHTTDDQRVDWTITPIRVTRPTPVMTVAVLEGSGGIEFSWNGWTSDFDGVTVGTTSDKQLPSGKFTALNAGIYYVCVSLRDKVNTVWEDGTTDDFTVAFTVLDEAPVTSVTRNGEEIGLDGLAAAELVIGDTIVIRTADGYTAYIGDTALSGTYTVPDEVGTTLTFAVKNDGSGRTVYSTTKTVLSPFTKLLLNGKPLTYRELADAILYRGSRLTFDTQRGYAVWVLRDGEKMQYMGGLSLDRGWTSVTIAIGRDEDGAPYLFTHTYTLQTPVLSVTVDGVEKDGDAVLSGRTRLPVGASVVFTLPDGYTIRTNGKSYASGDALTVSYYNADFVLYFGDSYSEHLDVRVGLAESITVNGKEIDGDYEMTPDDEDLVFRITSRLPVEWSAEYADGTFTDYLPVAEGTFTVPARGLITVRLSFELEPHSTAASWIGIHTYTNIAGIGGLYPELGSAELTRRGLTLMGSGNNADYDLPLGFLAGLDVTFKDGFTGSYRVKRLDGTVIDENGQWVNGGYGDIVALGWRLTLEILDDTGAVVETRTMRYNIQQQLFWTGARTILTGGNDDPAYLYVTGCTPGTAYDTDAWINLIFGDRTDATGILPTVIVNGGNTVTFTGRDVYTLDCAIVCDLGDGRRLGYRTELVVNLTEDAGDFLGDEGITLADRSDEDMTETLLWFYENRYGIGSDTVAHFLQNGFTVREIALKEGYTLLGSSIVVQNTRAYLRLVFEETETQTAHTVVIHLVSYARFDSDTTVDEWQIGQFGSETGDVTPDGDTLTLEDFNSTKFLVVSPSGSSVRLRLYDADGTLLAEEYGTMYITFPAAGTYTLELTSADGTATRTCTIVVKGAFDPLFEIVAGEGDGERTLWADNDDGEEMPIGNCYLYYGDDGTGLFGYFGRGMQTFIVTIDGVEYLPVRLRSSLAGVLYADEDCTVPLSVGDVRLIVQTSAGRRYVEVYAYMDGDPVFFRCYLEDNTYPATITVGDTECNLRLDPDTTDYGDAKTSEDGIVLTVPAAASEVTTVTLKLTRVYADESYTVIDRATGKVYRVTDQDTLTVEIPVSFGEDGYVVLMICPEGATDFTGNVYPLLIVLAAE